MEHPERVAHLVDGDPLEGLDPEIMIELLAPSLAVHASVLVLKAPGQARHVDAAGDRRLGVEEADPAQAELLLHRIAPGVDPSAVEAAERRGLVEHRFVHRGARIEAQRAHHPVWIEELRLVDAALERARDGVELELRSGGLERIGRGRLLQREERLIALGHRRSGQGGRPRLLHGIDGVDRADALRELGHGERRGPAPVLEIVSVRRRRRAVGELGRGEIAHRELESAARSPSSSTWSARASSPASGTVESRDRSPSTTSSSASSLSFSARPSSRASR